MTNTLSVNQQRIPRVMHARKLSNSLDRGLSSREKTAEPSFLQNCDFVLEKQFTFTHAGLRITPVNPLRTLLGPVCRWVFGLHAEETSYARRGFRGATREMQA